MFVGTNIRWMMGTDGHTDNQGTPVCSLNFKVWLLVEWIHRGCDWSWSELYWYHCKLWKCIGPTSTTQVSHRNNCNGPTQRLALLWFPFVPFNQRHGCREGDFYIKRWHVAGPWGQQGEMSHRAEAHHRTSLLFSFSGCLNSSCCCFLTAGEKMWAEWSRSTGSPWQQNKHPCSIPVPDHTLHSYLLVSA